MNNNRQKSTHPEKTYFKKLPLLINSQLVRLTSGQLNQINGGAGDPSGGVPDSGPDGLCNN